MKKKWYESKTLWAALFAFAATVASEIFLDPSVAHRVREAEVWALPALMAILRLITSGPLGK